MKYTDKQLASVLIDLIESSIESPEKVTDEFVSWLSERSELKRIRNIIRAVDSIWTETYGAATITVESSHNLPEGIKEGLEKVAKGAEIRESINEELIGGAKIRIDDRIIDGSIKGKLEQLTKAFSQA